jgi:hypothetical protein
MIIVIGILGVYLMLKILEKSPMKNQSKYLIASFILLISIIDGQHEHIRLAQWSSTSILAWHDF